MKKLSTRVGVLLASTAALGAMALAEPGNSQGMTEHVGGPVGVEVQEDSPEWSCADMGNKVCGVGNPQGAPAGCYDDGGVLASELPCHWETDAQGYRYLFTADGEIQRFYPTGEWDRQAESPLSAYSVQLLITEMGES